MSSLPLKSTVYGISRYLSSFWNWWTSELLQMLPKTLHFSFSGPERYFIFVSGEDATLVREINGRREQISHFLFPTIDKPINLSIPSLENEQELVLCLPNNEVLSKTITLPAAAEENLREVLGYEMDRQTPFRVEDIYYDYKLAARDREKRDISVNLLLAPKQYIDTRLSGLEKIDIYPSRITTNCESKDSALFFNLLPKNRQTERQGRSKKYKKILHTMLVFLAIFAIATPLIQKQMHLQKLEPEYNRLLQEAGKAKVLRTELDSLNRESSFLIKKKRSNLLSLQILNELTELIPDDTWVNQFEQRSGEIQIRGQSASAAALITILESSPLLRNPRFRSPVTKVRKTETERFHISVETVRDHQE